MEQDEKLDALIFDLVEWVAKEPRLYADVSGRRQEELNEAREEARHA